MHDHGRRTQGDLGLARPRFPDLFLVGHPKSGTSAMYQMLRQHPDIYMSPTKEPWYFASDGDVPPDNPPRMDREAYLALFSEARRSQILGEASPVYLWSYDAANRIADANPGARIIAILREPASFVRSMHLQFVRAGAERITDLRAALAASPGRPLCLRYDEHVRYVDQIKRYRAVFPEEQLLVLIYDDYRASNTATLSSAFRFLGVDDRFEVTPTRSNPSAGLRYPAAAVAWRRLRSSPGPMGEAARLSIRTAKALRVHNSIRDLYRRANQTSPPVDGELMDELRRRFAPEVRRAGEYLGQDLCALWGYPDNG